jgi:signal transduction histidine kinase
MDPLLVYLGVFLLALVAFGLGIGVYFSRTDAAGSDSIDAETLLNAVDEALLILDTDGTVLAANVEFRSLFDEDPQGKAIESVLADHRDLLAAIQENQETVVSLATDSATKHFDVCCYEGGGGRRNEQRKIVLLHDVTDSHEEQQALEQQNERLEEFASLISHDLRNPLDVAIGRTNALKEMVDDEELDHQLTKTQDAHKRMHALITDVLTLAREGQEIGELEPVDIGDKAATAWDHVETKDATLDVMTDNRVRADPERLVRMFENLFRNAVQHGGEDVTVTVGWREADDGFVVADDGVGIPDDDMDEVMEAGFSEDNDSTGLGLAIVNRIAQAHGWEVEPGHASSGGAQFEFVGVETVTDEYATAKQ